MIGQHAGFPARRPDSAYWTCRSHQNIETFQMLQFLAHRGVVYLRERRLNALFRYAHSLAIKTEAARFRHCAQRAGREVSSGSSLADRNPFRGGFTTSNTVSLPGSIPKECRRGTRTASCRCFSARVVTVVEQDAVFCHVLRHFQFGGGGIVFVQQKIQMRIPYIQDHGPSGWQWPSAYMDFSQAFGAHFKDGDFCVFGQMQYRIGQPDLIVLIPGGLDGFIAVGQRAAVMSLVMVLPLLPVIPTTLQSSCFMYQWPEPAWQRPHQAQSRRAWVFRLRFRLFVQGGGSAPRTRAEYRRVRLPVPRKRYIQIPGSTLRES